MVISISKQQIETESLFRQYKKLFRLTPAQILVLGFLLIITIGTVLLMLPISSKSGESVGFVDALFTTTSAVCVTGLAVVNTLEHWTILGQVVIITLIQIGGLGFMTMVTLLLMLLGKKVTLRERILIQESLNQISIEGMVRLAKNIIVTTLIIEGFGAYFLAVRFIFAGFPLDRAIYYGIFHSISAFCNAGFDLLGNSMMNYVGDPIVNIVIMSLIIIGGLGFAVWMDIAKIFRMWKRKEIRGYNIYERILRAFQKLTLHSKLVLMITACLILGGFLFFFAVEYSNPKTLGPLSFMDKIWGALFQSVTTRTAGFNSIDQASMNHGSKFMTIILMFIGGSPGSTAGGIKTVTAGIIFFTVMTVIHGKQDVEVYKRKIPNDIVMRSIAIILLGFIAVTVSTMILALTEQAATFEEILFECVSAFATVGLSLGITGKLSVLGKIVISILMFLGRLGTITTVLALMQMYYQESKVNVSYPEERILVG